MKSLRADSEALLREIDGCALRLRVGRPPEDVALAEAVAAELRRLVRDTAGASAADRARVRAAVNYFASRAFSTVSTVSTVLAGPGRRAGRARPALRLVRGGRADVTAAVVTEILGELTPGAGRPAPER